MKVVLDTNVLISGAFFAGPPLQILQSCIEGEFQLVLSPEILVEYRRVGEEFSREPSNPEFERLLGLLVAQALIVEAPVLDQPICRDPDDDKFIACALAVGADVIVSGDKDLLSISGKFPIPFMRPKEFVDTHKLVVYATSTRAIRPRFVLGTEFRFVRCKPGNIFGTMDHWVTKTRKLRVSDLERTIIDGLKQPEYYGGFSEVTKGFWMRNDDKYAMGLDIGAVYRRLGYLLELFDVESPGEIKALRQKLTPSYAILDPVLPQHRLPHFSC